MEDRLIYFLADTYVPRPDEALEKIKDRKLILDLLQTLAPREEKVMMCRIGLCPEKETYGNDGIVHTLDEIGAKPDIHVTRERVRQIEAKAVKRLRHPSRSKKFKVDFGLVDPEPVNGGKYCGVKIICAERNNPLENYMSGKFLSKETYKPQEVAAILRLSERAVYQMVTDGVIASGNREQYEIAREEIARNLWNWKA